MSTKFSRNFAMRCTCVPDLRKFRLVKTKTIRPPQSEKVDSRSRSFQFNQLMNYQYSLVARIWWKMFFLLLKRCRVLKCSAIFSPLCEKSNSIRVVWPREARCILHTIPIMHLGSFKRCYGVWIKPIPHQNRVGWEKLSGLAMSHLIIKYFTRWFLLVFPECIDCMSRRLWCHFPYFASHA